MLPPLLPPPGPLPRFSSSHKASGTKGSPVALPDPPDSRPPSSACAGLQAAPTAPSGHEHTQQGVSGRHGAELHTSNRLGAQPSAHLAARYPLSEPDGSRYFPAGSTEGAAAWLAGRQKGGIALMEGGEGKGVAVLLLLVAGMESAGGCGVRGWEWGLRSCGIALRSSVHLPMGTAGLCSGLRQGDTVGVGMAPCLWASGCPVPAPQRCSPPSARGCRHVHCCSSNCSRAGCTLWGYLLRAEGGLLEVPVIPQISSYESVAKAVQHLPAVQCLLPVQPSSIWDLCPVQRCCVVTSGAVARNPASSWGEQGGIFPLKMLSAPCRPCQQCGRVASPVLLLPGLGPWPALCCLCTVGSAVQD